MKWWYLVTLMLCMLLAWQVNAEEDDDGVDDDCDEPLMKREVGKVSAVVHKRRVTLRRLPEEGCFVPPGLQCSMKGRKKLYERLEKEAKGRSGEAGDERPDREGGAGKGKGMPDGEMPEGGEKPEGSELPEGGEKERGLMRGKEALKEKVCKRFGKRTDLKFKYIERLNINPNTTSEKAMIRDIDVKSVVNDTNIPNTQSEADSSAMIKGLRVVLSTIYPGRDAQTNATADVTMYIAKGAGTLTVGDFTGAVKEGDLKFTIDISDSDNWLCSADRSQCDDFVRLVLSLGGDNGKVKGKKKKTCANNLNCGQEMETNSGATLQIANEATVDGTSKALTGDDGSVSINEDGEVAIVFKFTNTFFLDPTVGAATENDAEALRGTDYGETSGTSRTTFSVLLLFIIALGMTTALRH